MQYQANTGESAESIDALAQVIVDGVDIAWGDSHCPHVKYVMVTDENGDDFDADTGTVVKLNTLIEESYEGYVSEAGYQQAHSDDLRSNFGRL